MDAAAVVGAGILGILIGPVLVRLVQRVPVLAWAGAVGSDYERPLDPVRRDRAVRVLAPVLFAAGALRWGATWVLVPFLFLFAVLLVISVIDLEHYRIPDKLLFPALAVSVPMIVAVSAIEGVTDAVPSALVGAVAYFVLLLVPHLLYPRGLGFGDVKLALLMGLYLGWIYLDVFAAVALVMWALVLGSGIGVVIGVGYGLVRGKRAEFPFGPSLAAGCVLAICFSDLFVA